MKNRIKKESVNVYANFKLKSEPDSPELKKQKKLRMNKSAINFHSNFVDLNPDYTQQRYERNVQGEEKHLGSLLQRQADKEAREQFKSYIEDGNTLSYNQLRRLNSIWRKDYHGKVIRDSDMIKQNMEGWMYDLKGNRVRINQVGSEVSNLLHHEKSAYDKTQRAIAELARQKIDEYNQNQYGLS